MKKLLLSFVMLLAVGAANAQCTLPEWEGNTGSNMTVFLASGFWSVIDATDPGAYIVAQEGDLVVGSLPVASVDFNVGSSLAVWGDDTSTPAVDGAATGGSISLFLVDGEAMYALNDIAPPLAYMANGTMPVFGAPDVEWVCGSAAVLGCTNSAADNFNAEATDDDGSCVITGCMDSAADNYDASANNAGDCDYSGCTNAGACNYDAGANVEDGSCTYAASGYDCDGVCLADADGDGVCDAFEVLGCMDDAGCNYNPDATDAGFCSYPSQDWLDCSGECNFDDDGDGICNELESEGCTNSAAFNYNPAATDDDGSCIAVALGCIDEEASNYDASANTDNGLCQYPGCTDSDALNYDADANVNDGSCIMPVEGCTNENALNYNAAANVDDGSCEAVVTGCTDDAAINYNSLANVDDGSCIMPAAGFDVANSNTGNNATIFIDQNAFDFSEGANLGAFFIDENGEEQCAGVLSWNSSGGNLIVVNGDDPNTAAIDGAHGEIIWKTNVDGQAVVLFATYGAYGPESILGNNQYAANAAYLITGFTIAVEGCMDPGYVEYNAAANVDDGTHCSTLFSDVYSDALSQIDVLNDEVAGLEADLLDANTTLSGQILDLQAQLASTIADYDAQLVSLENYWNDLYNQDMNDLENYMQDIIDAMQAAWDLEVAGLQNDLAVLNQGLLDSIASYEGQLSDMQAAWDADAADYQGQLADMQAAWDADAADYQDQLSTLVDNHADVVAELNGQIDALQAEYDGYVIQTDAEIADMISSHAAELSSMEAAWDAEVAQLTQDAADAADAAALLLANTIQSYDNQLADQEFEYTNQIAAINTAHNAQLEEIAYLDSQEDAAYEATIDGLNADIDDLNDDKDDLNDQIDGLNADIDGLNGNINDLNGSLDWTNGELAYYSNPIVVDLNQGWNMIGFSMQQNQDVALTLESLGNSLHLIKNNNASVYWPEFGFNSLGILEPGQGYQIRMYYSVPEFTFPEYRGGERLEVTPQVPDWVHDMVVPTHPNDVRTLVSVVNMLGQEVSPRNCPKRRTKRLGN